MGDKTKEEFYIDKVVATANGITAFAAVQGLSFAFSVLSSGTLQELLRHQTHPLRWTVALTALAVIIYGGMVIACWRFERDFATSSVRLRRLVAQLMIGRLIIIVAANIPLILSVLAALQMHAAVSDNL